MSLELIKVIIDLNNDSVEYISVPEQVAGSCTGCAFDKDNNCLVEHISGMNCIKDKIIWKEYSRG